MGCDEKTGHMVLIGHSAQPDSLSTSPRASNQSFFFPFYPKSALSVVAGCLPSAHGDSPGRSQVRGSISQDGLLGFPCCSCAFCPCSQGSLPPSPLFETTLFLSFSSSTQVQTLDSHSFTLQVNNVLMISTPDFGDDISVGLSPRLLQICSNVSLKEKKFRALPAERFCKLLYTI